MNVDDLFDLRLVKGDGKVDMVIFASNGKVVQRFRGTQEWVAFDPPNAVEVGKKIIDCAVECGAKVEIQVPRRSIAPHKRLAMITRATHIYRSMTEKGRPPKDVAQHVVDAILSAIE